MISTTLRLLFLTAAAGSQPRRFIHADVAAWVRPAWIAWDPCLPYFIGALILVLGLARFFKQDAWQKHGLDKLIALGPLFLAVPIAVFGSEHFIAAGAVARMVPSWIPGHLFWVYFVGACLIGAALSLVVNQYAGLAAALFGIMLLLFEVLISIPGIVVAPGSRFAWAVALRDLAFSGGALAFAATHTEAWRTHGKHRVITLARFFIGIPITFFGVEHLLHPEFSPGVPLPKLTPLWVPAHLLWGYPTGVVFVVAGLCLIIDKETRAAATWLGLMILLLVLVIYVPIVVANPSDIGNGLNYLVDTLALSGAALLFAGAQRKAGDLRSTSTTSVSQIVAAAGIQAGKAS
jgi:uncharacterized membrane protein